MSRISPRLWAFSWFALAAGVVVFLYWPGLEGGYQLDDYLHLGALALLTPPLSLEQVARYVLAFPSRPLALATFAVQYGSWPDQPNHFKAVNLLVHLCNGGLLALLFYRLGIYRQWAERRALMIALLAASIWLIHPLFVSTTLYIVQRMTQLSTFFILLGVLAYLHGRSMLAAGHIRAGYIWCSAAIVVGTGMATLCKETGVLLPLYVLVVEATVAPNAPDNRWRWWRTAFLYAPTVLLVGYFATHFSGMTAAYVSRDFSLGERLLTQPRVLLDYLYMLLSPRPGALGLYHDDYSISHGLVSPPSTLVAIVFLGLLFASAIKFRSRYPLFGFAVLWFLIGHALESSFLPLELYFEHRNYLPMAGFVLWLAASMVKFASHPSKLVRVATLSLSIVWIVFISLITWNESRLWGNELNQAITWANEHPQSKRAQTRLGEVLMHNGDREGAVKAYLRARDIDPEDPIATLALLQAGCQRAVAWGDLDSLSSRLTRFHFSYPVVNLVANIANMRASGQCPRFTLPEISRLFAALLSNKAYRQQYAVLFINLASLQAREGQTADALASLERAISIEEGVEIALLQTKIAAESSHMEDARRYLERAKRIALRESPLRRNLALRSVEEFATRLGMQP